MGIGQTYALTLTLIFAALSMAAVAPRPEPQPRSAVALGEGGAGAIAEAGASSAAPAFSAEATILGCFTNLQFPQRVTVNAPAFLTFTACGEVRLLEASIEHQDRGVRVTQPFC